PYRQHLLGTNPLLQHGLWGRSPGRLQFHSRGRRHGDVYCYPPDSRQTATPGRYPWLPRLSLHRDGERRFSVSGRGTLLCGGRLCGPWPGPLSSHRKSTRCTAHWDGADVRVGHRWMGKVRPAFTPKRLENPGTELVPVCPTRPTTRTRK